MDATAVIVNEFGEIGLDQVLIERSVAGTVLLNNGCVCCTVRGDLGATLVELLMQRVRGEIPEFHRVMIETTGLADPAPILHLLMADPIVAVRYRLGGVVTTVDAVNGADTLDRNLGGQADRVADRLLARSRSCRQCTACRLKRLRAQPRAHDGCGRRQRDISVLFDTGLYNRRQRAQMCRTGAPPMRPADEGCEPGCSHEHHHGQGHGTKSRRPRHQFLLHRAR
jgi:G3E family GTPase